MVANALIAGGHARRGFFKCHKDHPESLYVLERILDFMGTDAHLQHRAQLSTPVVEEIIAWCREKLSHYNPKSPTASAIGYVINQWPTLVVFQKDPRLRLDNNVSERARRIHALGRNNFLFVGHDEPGQNLTILQTLVATCKLHNVNPYDYLVDILMCLPNAPPLANRRSSAHELGSRRIQLSHQRSTSTTLGVKRPTICFYRELSSSTTDHRLNGYVELVNKHPIDGPPTNPLDQARVLTQAATARASPKRFHAAFQDAADVCLSCRGVDGTAPRDG